MLDNAILISIQEYDKDLDKVFREDRVITLEDYDKWINPEVYLANTVNQIRQKIKEQKNKTNK